MHVEQIRFERVFDAAPARGDFSFSSGGKTTYGAILPSRAIPLDGDSYTMVFAKPGDWSTLLGYRDARSGRIWLRHRAGWVAMVQLEALGWIVALTFGAGLALGGVAAATALAAAAGVAAFTVFQQRNRQVRRLLQATP